MDAVWAVVEGFEGERFVETGEGVECCVHFDGAYLGSGSGYRWGEMRQYRPQAVHEDYKEVNKLHRLSTSAECNSISPPEAEDFRELLS